MTTNMRDPKLLRAVSPYALSAYARFAGWSKAEEYGDYSDVYEGHQLPEIIVPRTTRLGDYAQVVAQLLSIFAQVAEVDEVTLYGDLILSDRDVTRVTINDGDDGTIGLEQGANLITGSRTMVLAAASSLREQGPVYRLRSNRQVNAYMRRVRLGQTERGSFVVSILSPVISPNAREAAIPESDPSGDPLQRQVTRRLAQALSAARDAASKSIRQDTTPFLDTISEGTSANLCEALVRMIGAFNSLEVSTTWALTRPRGDTKHVARFSRGDAPILKSAAKMYRSRKSMSGTRLLATVQRLKRDYTDRNGTVTLRASIDGRVQSVTTNLNESDYNRALQANNDKLPIEVVGDLEPYGQSWRLSNPRIIEIIVAGQEENEIADVLP